MPKHIVRLILLVVALGAIGYAARTYFTAATFYEYGHYRGASVAEIAADKPKYKGSAYCQSCHAQQYAEWSKGIHNSAAVGQGRQLRDLPRPRRQPGKQRHVRALLDRHGSPEQSQAGRSDRHGKTLHLMPRADGGQAGGTTSNRRRHARRRRAVHDLPQPPLAGDHWRGRGIDGATGQRGRGRSEGCRLCCMSWPDGRQRKPSRSQPRRTEGSLSGSTPSRPTRRTCATMP